MTDSNVVDYFFVCGVDKLDRVGGSSRADDGDTLQLCLEDHITPIVLEHYPDVRISQPFDPEATRLLALPDGVQVLQEWPDGPPSPTLHCFVITRQDGVRIYGYSYIFYETVPANTSVIRSRHPQCVENASSECEFVEASELAAPDHHEYHLIHQSQRNVPSSSSSSELNCEDSLQALPSGGTKNNYNYLPSADTSLCLVSKCIGVLMSQPHLNLAATFLPRLYRHSQKPCCPLPLESHIGQLLFQLPAPAVDVCVRVPAVGSDCLLQLPGSEELPLLEHSLAQLSALIGVDSLVSLLSCMLLEYQIVLLSRNYYNLTLAAESLNALLFPFVWPHVYVPVLPRCLAHFVDAPVPFLMGLTSDLRRYSSTVRSGNICSVDLDSGEMSLPEDIPSLPGKSELIEELHEHLNNHCIYRKHLNKMKHGGELNDGSTERMSRDSLVCVSAVSDESGASVVADDWELLESGGDTRVNVARDGARGGDRGTRQEMYPGQNESLRRISQLVKCAGLDMNRLSAKLASRRESERDLYLAEQRCNVAVREVVLNRLVHILHAYEQFIIQPKQDMETWLAGRDSSHSFDSAAFLSDQPRQHLPFLSRFIDTQLFSTFIDRKLLMSWGERDADIQLFDARVRRVRLDSESLVHTPSCQRCTIVTEVDTILVRRLLKPSYDTQLPLQLPASTAADSWWQLAAGESSCSQQAVNGDCVPSAGHFPALQAAAIKSVQKTVTERDERASAECRRQQMKIRHRSLSDARQQLQQLQQAPALITGSPDALRENNWKFVEHALKECKTRTKRLLVEKMGAEAAALGHQHGAGVGAVEENTLVTSLCDLIERIWGHGRVDQQGKSALWAHLCSYQSRHSHIAANVSKAASTQQSPNTLPPADEAVVGIVSAPSSPLRIGRQAAPSPSPCSSPLRNVRGGAGNGDTHVSSQLLRPLPVSAVFDMQNVLSMSDVCTEIGYARAWIRLALEKKLLAKHLRSLLSDDQLLRDSYKRYAFLRSEEEREQLLCHLLSLNAVDYFSFSTCYPSAVILYRVVIFTCSRKATAATTTANVWIRVSGSLAETCHIQIPSRVRHITFKHKNLGVLSTVQIGHDNSGASPNWRVEHVLVRNELTAGVCCFPCGRWLGRSIDDGSTERVLVGRLLDTDQLAALLVASSCGGEVRSRSPSVPRRRRLDDAHVLQQTLGDAVNAVVKYFHRPERERGSLALLLCGEAGLVPALQQVFLLGFRSNRLFGRNLYLWDFLGRVRQQLEYELEESGLLIPPSPHSPPQSPPPPQSPSPSAVAQRQRALCRLIGHVDRTNGAMGKDDRFHVWLLIALRDRLLSEFVGELSVCSVTQQMYEVVSFLRAPELLHALVQLLATLHEYEMRPERSLMRGVYVPTVAGGGRGRRSHSLGPDRHRNPI